MTSRAERLAAAILADRARAADVPSRADTVQCFMCGYSMVYRANRFCSDRCRNFYDAGAPGHEQNWLQPPRIIDAPIRDLKVMAGPPGLEIGSSYYGALFDKRGAQRRRRPKIPCYSFNPTNGHVRWTPGQDLRRLGFKTVDLGFDGPEAWDEALRLNAEGKRARKRLAFQIDPSESQ
jgi:hypothetical protein